jgi:hypothetical protein
VRLAIVGGRDRAALIARDLSTHARIRYDRAMVYARFIDDNQLTMSEVRDQLLSIGYPLDMLFNFITRFGYGTGVLWRGGPQKRLK